MRKQRLRKYLAQGHKAEVKAAACAYLPQFISPHSRQKPHLGEAWSSGFLAEGSLNSALKICLWSCLWPHYLAADQIMPAQACPQDQGNLAGLVRRGRDASSEIVFST